MQFFLQRNVSDGNVSIPIVTQKPGVEVLLSIKSDGSVASTPATAKASATFGSGFSSNFTGNQAIDLTQSAQECNTITKGWMVNPGTIVTLKVEVTGSEGSYILFADVEET